MTTAKLLERVGYLSVTVMVQPNADVTELLAAVTDENRHELVAWLRETADRCAPEAALSTMPNFMPRGNPYNKTGAEPFQPIGWLVGKLAIPEGKPILESLFTEHASREVRLAAGHFLLGYPGMAERIAEAVVERAATLVGWFRLWCGALLVADPATAYVAIADRIATTKTPKPLLDAAMDAGWHHAVSDPRWADLAVLALEHSPRHHAALTILVAAGDRRAVPWLLAEVASPDIGTSSIGLEKLAKLLPDEALAEVLGPIVESATYQDRFTDFFARHGGPACQALVAKLRDRRIQAIAQQDRPFLFFGAHPGDWYEGANDGHRYVICFEGTHTAAMRKKLATAIKKLRCIASQPWLWGELDGNAWAYFYCGGEPFDEMQAKLPAVHAKVPIREVIFGGAREESERDEWTIWSHAQQRAAPRIPRLDPGLAYDMIGYVRRRELVDVTGVVDPAFEAARLARR